MTEPQEGGTDGRDKDDSAVSSLGGDVAALAEGDESEARESLFPLSSGGVESTVHAFHNQLGPAIHLHRRMPGDSHRACVYWEAETRGIRMTHSCTMLLILTSFPSGADLSLHRAHRLPVCVRVCIVPAH